MDWTWQKLWAVKSSFIDWWLCGTTFISIKETEGPGLKLAAARRKMMSVWRERAEPRAVTEGLMLDYLVLQQKQKCSCQQNMPDSWHKAFLFTYSLHLHLGTIALPLLWHLFTSYIDTSQICPSYLRGPVRWNIDHPEGSRCKLSEMHKASIFHAQVWTSTTLRRAFFVSGPSFVQKLGNRDLVSINRK